MGWSVKEQALFQCIQQFENLGFMEWHARVLRELTITPQTIKQLSRKTGLFHYHIEGVLADLLALQLIEYTRYGIQIVGDWEMLAQLVDSCEGDASKKSLDWEAAFEVVNPRVVSLKKVFRFDE